MAPTDTSLSTATPQSSDAAMKSDLAVEEKLGERDAVPSVDLHGDLEDDRAEEKMLVRRLDLHLIPVVMLLYLLSFLDR